jgi:hypothetical protein
MCDSSQDGCDSQSWRRQTQKDNNEELLMHAALWFASDEYDPSKIRRFDVNKPSRDVHVKFGPGSTLASPRAILAL